MPLPRDQAWFPSKRYGYGWGLPCRWQGWLVFIGFFVALFAGLPLTSKGESYFVLYAFSLSTVLIIICWWKGEPARWRWGGDQ